MGRLLLDGLDLRYRNRHVVRDLNLAIEDGEMVSLLGPSGAGKTTILKAVAGILRPDAGDIRIDGKRVNDLPPEQRDAVMVFQDPLLFPFLNVAQNVAFGLRMQGRLDAAGRREIGRILELTGLKGLEKRKVHEISGGQQQRVSLARALVLRPAVLLADEPLSNLDASLRGQMRTLIQDVQAETRITMLFVTHDQAEALVLSHRVALLLDGRLRQVGSPRDLFHRPTDEAVARFFGGENFFHGRLRDGHFHCTYGRVPVPGSNGNGSRRMATIRPEDLVVSPRSGSGIPGRIRRVRFEGSATRLWIQCPDHDFIAMTADTGFREGQSVWVGLPPDKVRVFPEAEPGRPGGGGAPR